MGFSSGKGVVRGRRGPQLEFAVYMEVRAPAFQLRPPGRIYSFYSSNEYPDPLPLKELRHAVDMETCVVT